MDPKLKLKPIELLDIGIDKLTKIPIPILNDNVISTFNMDNGVPTDSFIFTFNCYTGATLSFMIVSNYQIILSIDYGDGTPVADIQISGATQISHIYTSAYTYTITVSGWLEKITTLILNGDVGKAVITAYLNRLTKLSYLDISNNRLTGFNMDGMIYLNTIYLDSNYLTNDAIDDLYIEADTFLTFNGNMSTGGATNGKPSIYSNDAINSLYSKGWTLNYNT